jgi:hypothetical protein
MVLLSAGTTDTRPSHAFYTCLQLHVHVKVSASLAAGCVLHERIIIAHICNMSARQMAYIHRLETALLYLT